MGVASSAEDGSSIGGMLVGPPHSFDCLGGLPTEGI